MTESPYAPQWPAPGGAPPYQQHLRPDPPTALAIATVAVSVGLTLVAVAGSVAAWPAARAYQDAIDEGRSSLDVFTWYDGLTLLLFPAMIAAYVIGCLWLQEARANTDPSHHVRDKVWVWLGWWVPVVSFWFPYQVVRDVRDGSGPGAARIGLGLWWTAWLVWLAGNRVASGVSSADDLVGALPTVELVNGIAAVIGCVLWCRIVLGITNAQKAMQKAMSPQR